MTARLFIPTPGNEATARALAQSLDAAVGQLELRAFPDGETYLRFDSDLSGRSLAIVCTLDRPNDKILPLLFAAATARELGAVNVGLVAPYLAYMRQDRRFKPGEAVTSREIAQLLSNAFDWLVTVDPHLHRYSSLSEIYRIPTRAVHAASVMAEWIKANVPKALIIGPDSESEQWVSVRRFPPQLHHTHFDTRNAIRLYVRYLEHAAFATTLNAIALSKRERKHTEAETKDRLSSRD